MLTKISHVTLFVHNQEDSLNFYSKLGFVIHTDAMFGTTRWLTLNLPGQGDLELVLVKAETPEEIALVGKQAATKPLISFESTDCFNDYLVLKAAGIEFEQEPVQQAWGTSVAFKDLYGNMLYIDQSI